MSALDRDIDWSTANQALLVAEFARVKALLAGEPTEAAQRHVESCRAALDPPAAIDRLQALLGLSAFERDLLLLCAGVEMDASLAELCARGGRGARASFGLALAVLPEPHWSALTPIRPLRRWRLIETDEREGLADAPLRIDERVLHYLAGINYLDPRLRPLLHEAVPSPAIAGAHAQARDLVLERLREGAVDSLLVLLHGDDADGQADIAATTSAALGLALHAIRAEDLPNTPAELDAFSTLWQREAALLSSALLIETDTPGQAKAVTRMSERLDSLCFIASRDPMKLDRPALALRIDKPDVSAQRDLWQLALGPAAARLNGSLNGVATQFRFSARTILGESARLRGTVQGAADPDLALWQSCRTLARNRLDDLAQRISSSAGWADLILPGTQLALLQQIATHLHQRLKVHQDWGFATKGQRGLGIAALFAGDSGTGKTLAAEVLANELHLDLYRIDLASVVSKYIGETEKNLKRVFDAGEESGAILLFDEADALFGKRSEVKDAHDRYANIEVSYLLQRMESYAGLAILTTNHKTALDSAFQRRLRFIVHFPFPDQAQRERIWRGIFPDELPRARIDYAKLARLSVAGGTIRNIALTSAFLAAEQGTPLGMAQLLRGTWLEAAKRDKAFSDAETRGWV
jgi:hypothetical protein